MTVMSHIDARLFRQVELPLNHEVPPCGLDPLLPGLLDTEANFYRG